MKERYYVGKREFDSLKAAVASALKSSNAQKGDAVPVYWKMDRDDWRQDVSWIGSVEGGCWFSL